MRAGLIQTPVRCAEKQKVLPTFIHLLGEASCAGITLCGDRGRLTIAFSCPSSAGTRQLKRAVSREIVLLKHHGLAAARRRRRR